MTDFLLCTTCKADKPIVDFSPTGLEKKLCRPCNAKRQSDWRRKNPTRARHHDKLYKLKDGGKAYRSSHLKHLFGITLEQYNEMLEAQKNVCAICGRPETALHNRTKRPKNLAVDHCHDTKKVRGLLCSKCNTAIGLLGHSTELLDAARQYLVDTE